MKLILYRGWPGSGKTSAAQRMFPNILHLENDMFMMNDGKYEWSSLKVEKAIKLCALIVKTALSNNADICISNTFTRRKYVEYYKTIADMFSARFVVYRCIGNFKNIHGLSDEQVERFKKSMEDYPGEIVLHPDE